MSAILPLPSRASSTIWSAFSGEITLRDCGWSASVGFGGTGVAKVVSSVGTEEANPVVVVAEISDTGRRWSQSSQLASPHISINNMASRLSRATWTPLTRWRWDLRSGSGMGGAGFDSATGSACPQSLQNRAWTRLSAEHSVTSQHHSSCRCAKRPVRFSGHPISLLIATFVHLCTFLFNI